MGLTIGLDATRIDATPAFGVNSFGEQADKAFVYVQINGAVSQAGEVVVIANDGLSQPITTSVDLVGRRVGIAPDVAAIGTYCWLLVRGESRFLVAGNCRRHSALRATAVGGVVDDAGSGPVIEGIVSTEDAGSMQGLVDGRLLHPTIQEQGGGSGGALTKTRETLGVVRYGTALVLDQPNPNTTTADRNMSVAHGLGRMPDGQKVVAECQTADRNYAVGDVIQMGGMHTYTILHDATTTYLYASGQGPWIQNKEGTANTGANRMDETRWTFTVTPYIIEEKSILTDVSGQAAVSATEIIDAVSGTPSTTLKLIEWKTGGTLEWAAGGGGGGGGFEVTAIVPTSTDGIDGDHRIHVNTGTGIVDSVYAKASGTWTQYAVNRVHRGTGAPGSTIGNRGDLYIQYTGSNATHIAVKTTTNLWSTYAIPSGGSVTLSDAAPQAPGTANSGTSADVSRADHVHPSQTVPSPSDTDPLAPGTAAEGTSAAYSRGDHVHPAGQRRRRRFAVR